MEPSGFEPDRGIREQVFRIEHLLSTPRPIPTSATGTLEVRCQVLRGLSAQAPPLPFDDAAARADLFVLDRPGQTIRRAQGSRTYLEADGPGPLCRFTVGSERST